MCLFIIILAVYYHMIILWWPQNPTEVGLVLKIKTGYQGFQTEWYLGFLANDAVKINHIVIT